VNQADRLTEIVRNAAVYINRERHSNPTDRILFMATWLQSKLLACLGHHAKRRSSIDADGVFKIVCRALVAPYWRAGGEIPMYRLSIVECRVAVFDHYSHGPFYS